MTVAVFCAIYAGALVFVVACAARAIAYARAPLHLRWELYAIPHEEAGRARHGGSYYEAGEWWTMHRRFNLLGELRFMAAEMVFLKGLWEWNRRLWYRSFPFHAGLYLLATAAFLLVVSAALTTVGQGPDGNGLAAGLRVLYRLAGGIGTVAAVAGAIALLHRRLTDRALRLYFVPADAANLAFFIVTIGLLAVGYLAAGSDFPGALEFTRALLRFDTTVTTPWLLGAGLLLASALVGYIPMTHMAHFIAKWFTYHAVRWDDRPLVRGDKLEHRIAACLAMRPTWAAPHIAADGTKTWARLATTNPVEGKKK